MLCINGSEISYSECEKLLGVVIDQNLSWDLQVDSVIKKCNSLLHLLSRIKIYLSRETRMLFFNAYIFPHLDYCSIVWGDTSSTLVNRLTKFQKRAARMILDADIDTPSAHLFSNLNWMVFPKRVEFHRSVQMYKIMNGFSPTYLRDLFTFTSDIHSRSLRSTSEKLLYTPKPTFELYRKSLSYSGSVMWNSIPDSIRQASCIKEFKKLCKNYLGFN